MKKFFFVAFVICSLIGLVSCTEDFVPVTGAPIALMTSPEFPAEALLVPMGRYQHYRFGYYDLDTGEVIWHLDLEDVEYLNDVKITFDDARIYVISPGYVRAYARQDGALVWETPFEGPVDSYCDRCFTCIPGRVLIQSKIGRISGLDASTGEIVWRVSQPREAYDDLGFYTSPPGADNTMIAIIARVEDDDQIEGVLQLINARDGSEIRQIEASCTPDEFFGPQTPTPDAFIHFDGQGETVHLWFEAFPRATCIQAWSVDDGTRLWEHLIPEEEIDSPLFWGNDQDPLLAHPDVIYAGRDGSRQGNGLTRIDLITGEIRTLFDDSLGSPYVCPVLYQEGVLVTLVQDDKVFKIWGVDGTTGDRLWSHKIAIDSHLNCALSNSHYLAVGEAERGVVILQSLTDASDDSEQLNIRLLDILTGEPLYTVERAFRYLAPNGPPVTIGNSLYFAADIGLYRFDTATGELEHVLGEEIEYN